jgi:hypothetical protein
MFDRCIIISVYMYISRNDWKQCDSLFGWINCKWECEIPKPYTKNTLALDKIWPHQNSKDTSFNLSRLSKNQPQRRMPMYRIYIYMKYMFHPSLLGPSEGEWRGDVCLKDYISVLLLAWTKLDMNKPWKRLAYSKAYGWKCLCINVMFVCLTHV